MKAKSADVRQSTIDELSPDLENANRGTQRGTGFMENSLRRLGAGRSIVADKHGTIIAGNQTLQAAASVGIENVLIVPTDGNTLVVVQRTDMDLTDPAGNARQYAFEDNRASELNLNFDLQVLAEQAEAGLNLNAGYNQFELDELYKDLEKQQARLANDPGFLQQYITPQEVPTAPIVSPNNSQSDPTANGESRDQIEREQQPPLVPVPADALQSYPSDTLPATTPSETPNPSVSVPGTASEEEQVQLKFLVSPSVRDRICARLKALQSEQNVETMAHALCIVLGVEYV